MPTATSVDKVTGQELWQSQIDGLIHLKRLDHRGEFLKDEIVGPHQRLHITPEERRLNQERIVAGVQHDPFTNGFLAPLRLVEGDDDTAALLANPNVVTDEEMASLLKAPPKTLLARLDRITNAMTLERIHAAAKEADVSMRRGEAIRERLNFLRSGETAGGSADEPDDDPQLEQRRRRRDREARPRSGQQL